MLYRQELTITINDHWLRLLHCRRLFFVVLRFRFLCFFKVKNDPVYAIA